MDKKTPSQDFEKNKSSIIIPMIAFSFILICWLLGVMVSLQPLLRMFALNKPTFDNGASSSIPIIDALERYKADNVYYPTTRYSLLDYDDTLDQHILYGYKYETYPFTGNPTAYMLSFRKRWSLDGWHCYYSEDQEWLESTSTCWATPRPDR